MTIKNPEVDDNRKNNVIDRTKTGRAKGTPNKVTKELKEMILGALDDVGGQSYLARQAEENPSAFMGLIGKVLPKDVSLSGAGGDKLVVQLVRFGDNKPTE
jgi:hypothetical protein